LEGLKRGHGAQSKREIEAQLNVALVKDTNLAAAHFLLGVVYADSGDNSRAVWELQHAVRLEPDNARAHYQLVQAYRRTKQTKLAELELKNHLVIPGGVRTCGDRFRLARHAQNPFQGSCCMRDFERAANGVLFNCLSQWGHPGNAIRCISLLEIVVSILRPHWVTLANDSEIAVGKNERIDVFGLGIVPDPADDFHVATMHAAYIPDPAIRKDNQVGSG